MCHLTLREGGEIIEINASFEKDPTNATMLPSTLWDIAGGMHHDCRPHTYTHMHARVHTHMCGVPGQIKSLDAMTFSVQRDWETVSGICLTELISWSWEVI